MGHRSARYHDGQPGIVEGLLSRGDRRLSAMIEAVLQADGRFDGWSEHFRFELWMHAAAQALAEHPSMSTGSHPGAERGAAVGSAGLRAGQGMALAGLAGRHRGGRGRRLPLDPCFDCGVSPQLDTAA